VGGAPDPPLVGTGVDPPAVDPPAVGPDVGKSVDPPEVGEVAGVETGAVGEPPAGEPLVVLLHATSAQAAPAAAQSPITARIRRVPIMVRLYGPRRRTAQS
jgi:hypothetical protein